MRDQPKYTAQLTRDTSSDGTPADQISMDKPVEPRPDLEASSFTDEGGVTHRTMPSAQE